jgi:hypothetical protein
MSKGIIFFEETTNMGTEGEVNIKLKVVDRETWQSRIVDLDEARTWDWRNPEVWRMIGGWQITSYNQLIFMLRQKEQKGCKEIEMLEAPRFMMLSGG